jgi:hypothetical protein
MSALEVTLQFRGRNADQHEVDLYDVSQALVGFERSLALTTHLVLNDEIITQAPALKGARIFARPSNPGSWELTAAIVIVSAGALYKLGTAPKDTPIGHLIRSAYDYVISQSLGFHVDYDKMLGQQYKEARDQDDDINVLSPARFDSLIEKCDTAVKEMHRPIYKSETADQGQVFSNMGSERVAIGPPLTIETYDYIAYTETSPSSVELTGRVSSYNINTFKGRIYTETYGRPVPFELSEHLRDRQTISIITRSLDANAQDRSGGDFSFVAFENHSRSRRLKSLFVTDILWQE